MSSERNILIAFLLNISFSVFELGGGLLTNSIAIISDAVHDCGDAISIGLSYLLEKKSKRKPDNTYTFGYQRYSILGAFMTTSILMIGSILVILGAINRLFHLEAIDYNGMILFAVLGVIINFVATIFTRDGDSLNQKAVNLHMLEDVLGWIVVLVGSLVIKYTGFTIIDTLMSIGVALFIFVHAVHEFKEIIDLFLEKRPENADIDLIKHDILEIPTVIDVHHVHVWSIDGVNNSATMHVICNSKSAKKVKDAIRMTLKKYDIDHVTIEVEEEDEMCNSQICIVKEVDAHHHHEAANSKKTSKKKSRTKAAKK